MNTTCAQPTLEFPNLEDSENPEIETTSPARDSDPELAAGRERVEAVTREFERVRSTIFGLMDNCPVLSAEEDYSNITRGLEKSVAEAYSIAAGKVKKAISRYFEAQGLENIEVESLDSIHSRGAEFRRDIMSVSFPEYWDSEIAKIEQYRDSGIKKFAQVIYSKLLGWNFRYPHTVKQQKACFVVSVRATQGFSCGYGWQTECEALEILDALKHVCVFNGLSDCFMTNSCRLALTQLFELGQKTEFCDDCSITTHKSTVKFRISRRLMEAIQVFLAEHDFLPPSE